MARQPHPLVAEAACRRKAAGMPVNMAAARAGVATTTVRSWEDGATTPSVAVLDEYLRSFGLRLTVGGCDEDLMRRLESEAISQRPMDPADCLERITPSMAMQNRRVLAAALGIDDDMPAHCRAA
jgi:DNA-binding XRE family transcriptional regulator